ncbi:MAG: DUF6089 family protein [Bacteroidia bacterium]|nr:DUF6089 family protein [Bacteroidia bacterium]
MKKINWFLLFLSLSLSLSGQRSVDYGVFLGTSSYLGDINPDRLLYSPSPAGGILFRYNFHPRQALRTSIFFGGLRANDPGFNLGTVVELAIQYEFNFFPYTTEGKQWNYTPYFAAGAGIAYIIKTIPVIPFSFGFKINLYKNLGLEAEYGFRKTFNDTFDRIEDPATKYDNAWIHNNDWYSFLGVGVTWKIFSKSGGCPAFSDVDPKRKL